MKIAAITMSHIEPLFLPVWIRHYGSRLGYQNLFIIDDSPLRDLAKRWPGLNIVRRPQGAFDEDLRAVYISLFHEALLKRYDAAIYADTDELLLPDPNLGLSLSDYVRREVADQVAAVGFNVLHNCVSEPAIDPSQPLFRQRRFLQFDPGYCKPLIARVPMHWTPGLHHSQHRKKVDTGLFLFHLRAVDAAHARERILNFNKIKLSDKTIRQGQSQQYRLEADIYIQKYFPDFDLDTVPARPELVVDDLESGALPDPSDTFRDRLYRVPERLFDSIELFSQGSPDVDGDTLPALPSAADWAQQLFEDCYWRPILEQSRASRNGPCPCGSGKRYKHCHGKL